MLAGPAPPPLVYRPTCILRSTPRRSRTRPPTSWRHRRDRDLSPARRALEPGRAAVSLARGCRRGDYIALLLENNPRFFEICWGAQRSGLIYTAISSRLTADEVEYIVERLRREADRHVRGARRQGRRARGADAGRADALCVDGAIDGLRRLGGRGRRAARHAASPTSPRATTCSIRRARRAGRRACVPAARADADRRRHPLLLIAAEALRHGRADDLPVARAALSRGAAALQHGGACGSAAPS